MLIRWKGQPQHTDWGTVKRGDEITVPDDVAKPWLRDGDAEEVKHRKAAPKSGEKE